MTTKTTKRNLKKIFLFVHFVARYYYSYKLNESKFDEIISSVSISEIKVSLAGTVHVHGLAPHIHTHKLNIQHTCDVNKYGQHEVTGWSYCVRWLNETN